MNNKPIVIAFQPKDLDYVANVLGQRPWAEVNNLIQEIQRQVTEQQQAPAPLPEVPAT